jgi:protein SCO1/2
MRVPDMREALMAVVVACAIGCHGESGHSAGEPVDPVDSTSAPCCDDESPPVRTEAFVVERTAYEVPDLTLVDQDGRSISLRECLDPAEGAVLLDFVFTTCSTICPVLTVTFAKLQEDLQDLGDGLRMVSVSIDPEYDTPRVLTRYAERYGADDRWTFLTGSSSDIQEVVTAFDALFRSKMGHRPFTYLRVAGDPEWTRYEGLGGATALATGIREALAGTP